MLHQLTERARLYMSSVRHLRWEQWVYRPIRRLQRRFPDQPEADFELRRWASALAGVVAHWSAPRGDATVRHADSVNAGEFTFLNQTERIETIDWRLRYVSHLWSYNLHYFDYALDLAWAYRLTDDRKYLDRFVELAHSWIDATRQVASDGWEPYALSLRTVNWTYALLLTGEALSRVEREPIQRSLAAQLEFLSQRLELHILANHLQKNLKALVVGGLYFGGAAGDRWLRAGTSGLWRELPEQVLVDGTQYERSPMYHAIALSDFLETIALLQGAGQEVPPAALDRVRTMARAQGVLADTSGRLHLFNDSAQGIAPPLEWISALANRVLGSPIHAGDGLLELPEGGYYGLQSDNGRERLLIDCGPLGPDYQPGHAHCDLLSFEWIAGGRPVVVDSGVRGYDGDPLREYCRSTRAHNTVALGGLEQAEVWGTFRVARRPRVLHAAHALEAGSYSFDGAYAPYHGRTAVHRRRLTKRGGELVVEDELRCPRPLHAASHLHLHPDFDVRPSSGGFEARAGSLLIRIQLWGVRQADLVSGENAPTQGWYCPEFGLAVPAPVIVMQADPASEHRMGYRIELIRSEREDDMAVNTTTGHPGIL